MTFNNFLTCRVNFSFEIIPNFTFIYKQKLYFANCKQMLERLRRFAYLAQVTHRLFRWFSLTFLLLNERFFARRPSRGGARAWRSSEQGGRLVVRVGIRVPSAIKLLIRDDNFPLTDRAHSSSFCQPRVDAFHVEAWSKNGRHYLETFHPTGRIIVDNPLSRVYLLAKDMSIEIFWVKINPKICD